MTTKCLLLKNIRNASNSKIIKRFIATTTITPEEKHLENPVLVVREQDQVEVIGPPDKTSNLRPVFRKRLLNETALQTKLREIQNDTQVWNQRFWKSHNKKFVEEKQEYINVLQKGGRDRQITADEMSKFYKRFLDDNWKTHVTYNKQWYKKNLTILIYSISVGIEKKLGIITKFKIKM